MELIVINSYGPMASSVVASILEYFGYINLPIRKRNLEEYVVGKRKLNDNFFKNKTKEILRNLSESNLSGGYSVLDRNNNKLLKKIDLELIKKDLEIFNNQKYSNVEDMYFESMLIANKGTIYKKKIKNVVGAIELSTYIEKQDNKFLFEAYKKEFKKVKFINMNRDFSSWINSLLSQKIFERNRSIIPNIVRLTSRKRDYDNYVKNSKLYEGLQINFNDIFLPKSYDTIKIIEKFISSNNNIDDYNGKMYDLYGSLRNFDSAFTKFDDNINYLSYISKKIISRLDESNFSLILDLAFQLTYTFDYLTAYKRVKTKI
mgnify:FL=1|tara:strand:- start:206 stop:1156 length:951 start_codon:yes stop_codon:yes gene_type:complete